MYPSRSLQPTILGPLVRLALVLFILTLGTTGCDERRERTISRQAFIETMVELRREAARPPLEGRTEEEIDEVLERRNVTRNDLRRFVEAHGGNVPMMAEIWAEIDRRVHADVDVDEEPERPPELSPDLL